MKFYILLFRTILYLSVSAICFALIITSITLTVKGHDLIMKLDPTGFVYFVISGILIFICALFIIKFNEFRKKVQKEKI